MLGITLTSGEAFLRRKEIFRHFVSKLQNRQIDRELPKKELPFKVVVTRGQKVPPPPLVD